MHLSILPKTFTGKLAIGFFVLFVATWTLVSILQPQFGNLEPGGAGQGNWTGIDFGSLTVIGILSLFLGFVTGLIAMIRKKERSVLVLLIVILCLLLSVIVIAFMSEGF